MPAGDHPHTCSRPFLDELLHDLIDDGLVTFKSKGVFFFPRPDVDVRAMLPNELNTEPGATIGSLHPDRLTNVATESHDERADGDLLGNARGFGQHSGSVLSMGG